MSPTAKPIKVFDEFHAFGSPVSNFQNGKQLLEKKCDAFGLSTPMPMMEAQLFSDSLSTAAPSPAMTNLSSAWTTPSSFDNTNTPCIVDCAPLLEAHLKLDGMGAPSCHAPSALQFGDSGMISCIEKMCKDMIFAPSSGRNFGIGFGLHDNPGNLLPPWPIMPSPPPLEQNTAAGMPRKNSESAALETPQIWHCSRTTPQLPKQLNCRRSCSPCLKIQLTPSDVHLNKTLMLLKVFFGNTMLSLLCALLCDVGAVLKLLVFCLSTRLMSMVLTSMAVPLLQFLLRAQRKVAVKGPVSVIPCLLLPKVMLLEQSTLQLRSFSSKPEHIRTTSVFRRQGTKKSGNFIGQWRQDHSGPRTWTLICQHCCSLFTVEWPWDTVCNFLQLPQPRFGDGACVLKAA